MANSQLQKLETNVHLAVPAEQLFDVFCNKTHNTAKIFSTKIQSIDLLQGEWGTEGSIICWNFLHGMTTMTFKFYQQKVGTLLLFSFIQDIYFNF